MESLKSLLLSWRGMFTSDTNEMQIWEAPPKKIESYMPGYPRFSALISAHYPFFLCRRFSNLRARLLLLKQDKLSMLEERLDEIDQNESNLLFLGKSRCDRNPDRISLFTQIEASLADYDSFNERIHRALSFDPAQPRDVLSLQNWVNGTGSLDRKETAYLAQPRELVNLAPSGDSATTQLEAWVEDKLIRFYEGFRQNSYHNISTDPNVYIYSGLLIKRTARALLMVLITFLMLAPAVICIAIGTVWIRMVVIIISTMSFLAILSRLTNSKTIELVVATAA